MNMKTKFVSHSGFTLFCCLCVVLGVTAASNLKIFRNINSFVEIPSRVEVLGNGNLTLMCKIENTKSKGFVKGYIPWFISTKLHSELKLRALKSSSNSVFRNMTADNDGLYVCGILKFKLISKILNLLVKQNKSAELGYLNFPRLTKREIPPVTTLYSDPATYSTQVPLPIILWGCFVGLLVVLIIAWIICNCLKLTFSTNRNNRQRTAPRHNTTIMEYDAHGNLHNVHHNAAYAFSENYPWGSRGHEAHSGGYDDYSGGDGGHSGGCGDADSGGGGGGDSGGGGGGCDGGGGGGGGGVD